MRDLRGNEIAMVFQEPMTSLNPVYTVGEQVMEAIRLHQKTTAAAARAHALEMFELLGIPEPEKRLDAYPHQISGGMRQRVMIAMALSCRPALLIADEPTTALDVTIQAQILELMARLQRELGMAVIFITHNLGVAAEIADRILVMYAGRGRRVWASEDRAAGPAHALHHRPARVRTAARHGPDLGRSPGHSRQRPQPAASAGGLLLPSALRPCPARSLRRSGAAAGGLRTRSPAALPALAGHRE